MPDEDISLDGVRWGKFILSDIFDIRQTANGIDKIKLIPGNGKYPYVTRSDMNNGINNCICEQPRYRINVGNCITVGLDTQTAFYQPVDFYTGQNIQILRNSKLNKYNAKFILPAMKHTLSIFSWGSNGATLTRLRRSKIFLPITPSGQPDYSFMDKFIRSIEHKLINSYLEYAQEKLRTPPPVNYLVLAA